MHLFLLMATALFPLAAHAASYRIVAPGTTSAAGQSASLAALAQAQKNLPFLQPGDDVLFPAGMLAPNDAGTFWDIGTAAKPVFFHSPAGQYTIVSNPSYVQSGKASLILYSSSIHVDGLIFMGNRLGSSDGNGAGIRPEVNYSSKGPNGFPLPYNLTVTNSGFIGNGNGILADDCSDTPGFDASYGPQPGPNPESGPCTVSIDHSWFTGNGDGSGLTHNMYIDRIDRFTITNSLVQNAFGGHNIKSRAFNSDVENNRIFDGPFGYSNNDIDFPVGGNEIVKNNMLEKGPLARGTFISWNEENYLPTLNNPGTSMVIDGNTFIDNWTAANSYYQAYILQDASQWQTHKRAATTNGPAGTTVQLTNNKIYSPKLNATNLFQYSPTTDVPGAGNTYDSHMADAPALNNTPPIAWAPPTTPQTLTVTANGVEDDTATYTNNPHSTDLSTFPHLVLWWNGLPLTPAPVVVTANALAQQKQTITYNVSVITGVPNYMAGYFANPGCCYIAPGGSHPGRQLYWQTALLGDGAPMDISSDWVAPGTNITFMPSNSPFR